MGFVQKLIHLTGVVGGSRVLRCLLVFLGMVLLALVYNVNGYRNFATQEAMDNAQLARNLASGKGYTTQFIRPFGLFLLQQTAERHGAGTNTPAAAEILKGPVPDVSNAPLYPLVLAGLMKTLPFDFDFNLRKSFWSVVNSESSIPGERMFWRYQPDFLIALFNQLLFVVMVALAFLWARRMFDATVAWISAIFLVGTELLWRFSVSGLPTMLLLVIFMGLVWCVTLLESEAAEPRWGRMGVLLLSVATGLMLGLGGLTSYGFAILILPVLIWVVVYLRAEAPPACLAILAACAVVMGPWLARNYHVSGSLFGTASYNLVAATPLFPGNHLDRSLNPDLQTFPVLIRQKFYQNAGDIIRKGLPQLGGNLWLTSLFAVGLMVGFRNPALRRLRHFLLLGLLAFLVFEALARTHLSEDSPQINSENFLVLLLPLVVIYAVSMFFVLLEQIQFPAVELRLYTQGFFCLLVCFPLAGSILFERVSPVVYPPYHPPVIAQTAGWMKADELMMSDIPWAVAWYGNRPAVWLSLTTTPRAGVADPHEDFFWFNRLKTVQALYLTPRTLDGRFLSDWARTSENTWGSFITRAVILKDVPDEFPLHEMPAGFLPEQIFLADSKRWQAGAGGK
ncbi:MAG: hypothetical protein U1F65_02555 [Verrucomicrobiota bacterium]